MKKYDFDAKDDIVTLSYGDTKHEFKTDVKLISEMQSIVADARMTMLEELSKKGISVKDLTIVKEENGKRYEDNSNREEMEEMYQQKAIENFIDAKCKEFFKKDLETLLNEINLTTAEEGLQFATDFMLYAGGNTPREENKQ